MLRAIVAYDEAHSRPRATGAASLWVDGRHVGDAVAFDDETQDAIHLPDASGILAPGEHTIEIRMADGSEMPCALAVEWSRATPASSSH